MPESLDLSSSLTMIPENTLLESYTRLSVSLEENGLFQVHHEDKRAIIYTVSEKSTRTPHPF